jgi:hypothetical protein
MNIVRLAAHLVHKYAQDLPDTSFGKPITPEKTKLLKQKLSQLAEYITNLPEFKRVEKELSDDYLFDSLKAALDLYSAAVDSQNLRENFQFFIKVIMKLNRIRNGLVRKHPKHEERQMVFEMDAMIKRVQDYIWENTKALINLHDLRGLNLSNLMPGAVMTLQQRIVPTWPYGPMRNPAKGLLHKQRNKPHPYKDLMKRLEQEMEEEKPGNPNENITIFDLHR